MSRRHFLAATLALPLIARAYHGRSAFDDNQPLCIEGKVKPVSWQNPHAERVLTVAADATLPADLAKRPVPARKAPVDGTKIMANARLPKRRGDWIIERSPMTRIEAWKVSQPKRGDTVAAIGFTFKDEKGDAILRSEYFMVGSAIYGLRPMPA